MSAESPTPRPHRQVHNTTGNNTSLTSFSSTHSSGVVCRRRLFGHMKSRRKVWDLHAAARPGNPAAGQGSRDRPTSDRKNSTCRPPTNAEGRPTQRFFSILLGESVALGEDACHFRHVLGSPGAQRDDRVGQAATERGQRVVHTRRHLLVVGPRQHVIGLQILQLLDRQAVLTVAYAWRAFRVFCLCVRRGAGWYPLGSA